MISTRIGSSDIDQLEAIFIAAPRELSPKRFTQLVKRYLPKANIIIGIALEPHVVGFSGQPQFAMLQLDSIQHIIDSVAKSSSKHKIYTFSYHQVDLAGLLQEHKFSRVLLVNGSWKYAFHNLPAYRALIDGDIPFKLISPFCDEAEAKAYESSHSLKITFPDDITVLSTEQMIQVSELAATESFDYSFQTGAALGTQTGGGYHFLASAFNRVIPYQTYALHHGNSREKNLSRPHDTNHYDTIHAEMALLVDAGKRGINLANTTLFVNLLPCPNCARTLSQTGIATIVYRHDHSDGYAVTLLEECGKKVKKHV